MAGYSYAPQQYYYTTPEVWCTGTSHVPNNYYASTTNSHVDVARYNNSMHIASASHCSDNAFYYAYHNNFENYMQRPMSNNMHALNFHATATFNINVSIHRQWNKFICR